MDSFFSGIVSVELSCIVHLQYSQNPFWDSFIVHHGFWVLGFTYPAYLFGDQKNEQEKQCLATG
jgi:hypothetical protein